MLAFGCADAAVKCGPTLAIEPRITCIMRQMMPEQKASLLSGTGGSSLAIPELGISAVNFSDGSHGVRTNGEQAVTDFPGGISVAATFDPAIVEQMGQALGDEARARNIHVLLGPGMNIQRFPLGGRNFEFYTEDPFLNGAIASAFVKGVQSEGVGATIKHFAANNQELNRAFSNSVADERTLREIYLAGFEKVVRDAKPWAAMVSYNKLNGLYTTENSWLLRDVLKNEWGFDGLVMSDWGAVHDTVPAINAGTDLEMPTPSFFSPFANAAVVNHQIEQSTVDDSVRRLLRLAIRTGAMDGKHPVGTIGSPAHFQLAEKIAEQSIVLLKNDRGLLPLSGDIKKLALIGPNVYPLTVQGGGSSSVSSLRIVSLLDAVKAELPADAQISFVPGVADSDMYRDAGPEWFSIDKDRKKPGLLLEYFEPYGLRNKSDERTHPFESGIFPNIPPSDLLDDRRVWSGYFWADRAGEYKFSASGPGTMLLVIDNTTVLEGDKNVVTIDNFGLKVPDHRGSIILAAGPHSFYFEQNKIDGTPLPPYLKFGFEAPAGSIDQAVAAAKSADVAVVVVGETADQESEGADRTSMDLFGQQNELVAAVEAANPRTVVVLNTGGPVAMPWLSQTHALAESFFPGQEGATALARVLFGQVDPSGRLPETFPMRLEDNPVYTSYPNDRDAFYGEGVFVGYRWYDKRNMDVLFPFGYGLSYTSFGYGGLRMPQQARTDEIVPVSVTVANTGSRAGAEVVQLYVAPIDAPLPRPVRELKGFNRIALQPGESQTVSFRLLPRDFSYWDVVTHQWVAAPGKYRIEIGASSRDLKQAGEVTLVAPGQ